MSAPALTVGRSTRLSQLRDLLDRERISAVGVVDAGDHLVGVVSRTDLLHVGKISPLDRRRHHLIDVPDEDVQSIMNAQPVTLEPDAPLSKAAKRMVKDRIHRVFITRNGALQGVLSTRDLMRAIAEQELPAPISDFATRGVVKVNVDDPVSLALDRMQAAHIHGVVVVERDWPVGLFAQNEALSTRDVPPTTPTGKLMNPAVLMLPEELSIHRAATQAMAMRARRVVLTNGAGVSGILSGIDFARAVV